MEEVLTLGFDLAPAMARGHEPDSRFNAQYKELRTHVDGLASYRETRERPLVKCVKMQRLPRTQQRNNRASAPSSAHHSSRVERPS